jgi:hypothetical protein
LASHADSLKVDPQLALNLAVRGALRWQTTEAEIALRRALALVEPGTREPLGHVGDPGDRFVALSVTGKYGVTLRRDGRLAVWQLRPKPRQVLGGTVLVGSPMFSQDESLIATRTSGGVLTVWNIEDGQRVASFENIQTATFSGRKGFLTFLTVERPQTGSLKRWNPKTGEKSQADVKAPRSVQNALFEPLTPYPILSITVDDRNVDTWDTEHTWDRNATYDSDTSRDKPRARYTDLHGITKSWFSEDGFFVVTTNANGSNILDTMSATLVRALPLRSLQTVAFSRESFMVAVPGSGPPAVVHMATGEIIATLPEKSEDVAAAAFDADGHTIVLASRGGTISQHSCIACLPFERALEAAKTALRRPLTLSERQVYLHERQPHPCELSSIMESPKENCLELAPDSGPPGTVVMVSLRSPTGEINFGFTDAAGKHWEKLLRIEAAPFHIRRTVSAPHVGTLTIPEGAALGPATVSADRVVGDIEMGTISVRTFSVICMWCDP